MANNFEIWLEEYKAITKAQLKNGFNRANARRILIWTEGFMHKTMGNVPEENTDKDMEIIAEIRKLNLEQLKKHDK